MYSFKLLTGTYGRGFSLETPAMLVKLIICIPLSRADLAIQQCKNIRTNLKPHCNCRRVLDLLNAVLKDQWDIASITSHAHKVKKYRTSAYMADPKTCLSWCPFLGGFQIGTRHVYIDLPCNFSHFVHTHHFCGYTRWYLHHSVFLIFKSRSLDHRYALDAIDVV